MSRPHLSLAISGLGIERLTRHNVPVPHTSLLLIRVVVHW